MPSTINNTATTRYQFEGSPVSLRLNSYCSRQSISSSKQQAI